MKPRISVLLPTYNTKIEYIKEAIDSILKQTYHDFELLILDDGSDKYVQDFVLTYHDDRIRYFYKNNTGIADTLNVGLDLAKGEYIARMDADDISLPHRFEKQVQFLDDNPTVSLVGSNIIKFQEDYGIVSYPYKVKCEDFFQGCMISHPSVMFRKRDFEINNLRYDPSFSCEDYELWSRASRVLKLVNLQEVLVCYRINEQSVCYNRQEILQKDSKRVKSNLKEYFDCLAPKLAYKAKNASKSDYKKRYEFDLFNKHIKLTKLNRKIAVVNLKGKSGSLGDQMFQYAFGKTLEYKYKLDVRYDNSFYTNQFVGFNDVSYPYQLYVFPNLEIKMAGNTCTQRFKRDYWFKIKNSLFKNVKNRGYFGNAIVNDEFFKPYETELRQIFKFSEVTDKNVLKILNEIQNSNAVFIDGSKYSLNRSLYNKCINEIKTKVENPKFFVFNDEHHAFNDCYYIDNMNEIDSMRLMSACSHGIITDSSDSWWSAWLINNPNKMVLKAC